MTKKISRSALLTLALMGVILASALASSSAMAAVNPQISTNYEFSCALKNDGTVHCFGDNDQGQLGNGTNGQSFLPVQVVGITNATQIATSDETACAVLADETVRCWGQGGDGELGDGLSTDSNVPVVPTGLTGVKAISGLDYSFCVLLADATVKCWGYQADSGQLGTGGLEDVTTPTTVPGLTNVVAVSVGQDVLCAVIAGGTVRCLGDDDSGELGNGLPEADSLTAVEVSGITNAVDVISNDESVCALLATGAVMCWGDNEDGQLGNGDETGADQPSPVAALLPANVNTIRAGYDNNCASTSDVRVFCWGKNTAGQSGGGAVSPASYTPVQVQGLGAFVELSQEHEATPCVIKAGGEVWCWGYNGYGQGGDGNVSISDILVPRPISNFNVTPIPFASAQNTIANVGRAKVDRKKRYYTRGGTFTMQPSVFSNPAVACAGTVAVSTKYRHTTIKTVKRRGKKVRKKVRKTKTVRTNAQLAPSGANCAANFSLKKLPVKYLNNKSITITAAFAGNTALEPATASFKTKLPKVKIKKKR